MADIRCHGLHAVGGHLLFAAHDLVAEPGDARQVIAGGDSSHRARLQPIVVAADAVGQRDLGRKIKGATSFCVRPLAALLLAFHEVVC